MKKIYVLDTSVICHNPSSFMDFKNSITILPITIFDEIDKVKSQMTEAGRNARVFCRSLDKILENKDINKKKADKPLISEVLVYFTEIGRGLEGEKFFDYFESNGWKVGGKTKMKDWKAAARNWCRRAKEESKRPEVKPFVPLKEDSIRLTPEQTKELIKKAMPRKEVLV